MAQSLPVFEKFDVKNGGSNLAISWKKWLARFENLVLALGITTDPRKRALLLHYAGEEVYDIYETFAAEEVDKYANLSEKLTSYFEPMKHTDYEIFKFRNCKQNTNEGIDEYVTRLRTLAKTCEFTDVEKEIKSQIILYTTSTSLRRKALREQFDF